MAFFMRLFVFLKNEMKLALLNLCFWGMETLRLESEPAEEPGLAAARDHYYFMKDYVDRNRAASQPRPEATYQEPPTSEDEMEIDDISLDDVLSVFDDVDSVADTQSSLAVIYPTLVGLGLTRGMCPICYGEPEEDNVSVVVLPCSHVICGHCLYKSTEHAMHETGSLKCPMCSRRYEG